MQGGKGRYLPMPPGIQLTAVTAITGDDEDGVWFSDARKGLYRSANGHITDFSEEPLLKGKSILAARGDGRGRVWFGLDQGGVVVFDAGQFHAFSEREGLAGGFVDTISVDDGGTVWFGAERGLSRFEGQRFVTWATTNGLPRARVLRILPPTTRRLLPVSSPHFTPLRPSHT